MEFSVRMRPYDKAVRNELLNCYWRVCPKECKGQSRRRTISVILLVVGLLPVFTLPIFHVWLVFVAFPPITILCVCALLAAIILWPPRRKIEVKMLAVLPDETNVVSLYFREEGVTLTRSRSGSSEQRPYSAFRKVIQTRRGYCLVDQENRMLAVRNQDFMEGDPEKFGAFLEEKYGKLEQLAI